MLVAPVAEPGSSELVGVVQLINNRAGMPFGQLAEEGVAELCQTLAIALKQRQKPQVLKTKYDCLVSDAVISAAEFELAARSARKKAVDVETVLIEEFQVKIPAIGAALAKFFGVPYEPFKPDRIKPMDLLKNLKRDYVESNQWVPIEEAKEGLVILCLDPERVKSSRIVQNVFAARKPASRVPTETPWWRASRSCATSTFPRSASRRTEKSNSRNSDRSTSSCAWRRSRLRAASKI